VPAERGAKARRRVAFSLVAFLERSATRAGSVASGVDVRGELQPAVAAVVQRSPLSSTVTWS